jgi:pSer/pThr/pTyr-binding forkhead associated (FHA) protein/MinD-like ATPase involved in chromosome partitioning or flagellar assembly/tRNA A-37 threonylcarbamoyl transferase component Bud32
MIFTFYSYKGGVGRSMALANTAELFYQAGLRVLMVDWDLEAPGLERFFPSIDLEKALQKPGLMDMLLRYKKQMAQEVDEETSLEFENPRQYVINTYPDQPSPGQLFLLTPGKRPRSHFADYARTVLTFDWQDFYKNWGGELYFNWLREEFESIADVVLIDSRTGVTEMGGVCTYHLADTVVMFCTPNQQCVDGTCRMANNFKATELRNLRRGRPLNVLIIPARLERAESDLLDKFQEEFMDSFRAFVPQTAEIDIQRLWYLAIPYIPKYSYEEVVAVREPSRASAEDMATAFEGLRQVLLSEMARIQPSETARKLALAFSRMKDKEDRENLLQLASLLENLAKPLAEFRPLLTYARVMADFARDDLENAAAQLRDVVNQETQLEVDGINLSLPAQVLGRAQDMFARQVFVHGDTQPILEKGKVKIELDPVLDSGGTSDYRLTLRVLSGDQQGKEYILWGLHGIISRGQAGQISLFDDNKVSRPHATLALYHMRSDRRDRIRDLGSLNGTYKNGEKLLPNKWVELNDGDRLRFGATKMRYDQANRQLVYEDGRRPPEGLVGNNRWLITRYETPFVDIQSRDTAISVPHAYIRAVDNLEIWDISSGNGVQVQGRQIRGKDIIFNEDIIRIGRETEVQVITDIPGVPLEIGDWRRGSWIGRGGMAVVYRVQHKESGDLRALKMPRPDKYRLDNELGERYRQLFKREIELSRRIQHPHLVEAYEFGEIPDSGLPYLLLDYVDGPSVNTILEKQRAMSVADVAEIAIQIGQALKALHVQHGYVHCDVKPNNIMIDFGGTAHLADLGIATPLGERLPGLGARYYLPHEVIDGASVGVDTDVYSLGRTMYEMVTGRPLSTDPIPVDAELGFDRTDPTVAGMGRETKVLMQHLPSSTEIQRDLREVIKKCVEEKRQNRYQNVEDLLVDLEPLRAGANLKAPVTQTGWKPST